MDAAGIEEKLRRLQTAAAKLAELRAANPAENAVARTRGVVQHLVATFGMCRRLAEDYVQSAERGGAAASAETLRILSDHDDAFGAAFMVLPQHVEMLLAGRKRMSRRAKRWGDAGDVFRVNGKRFRFVRVERVKVSPVTDDDICKEGYASRGEFEQMWMQSHPRTVAAGKKLNYAGWCWRHEYEPVD